MYPPVSADQPCSPSESRYSQIALLCKQAINSDQSGHEDAQVRLRQADTDLVSLVFEAWHQTKDPLIEEAAKIFSLTPPRDSLAYISWSLKTGASVDVMLLSSEEIDQLVFALFETEDAIADRASSMLMEFNEQELTRLKEGTRHHILVALQNKETEKLLQIGDDVLEILLEIGQEVSSIEAKRARLFLGTEMCLRSELCKYALQKGNRVALAVLSSVEHSELPEEVQAAIAVFSQDLMQLAQMKNGADLVLKFCSELHHDLLRDAIANIAFSDWHARFETLSSLITHPHLAARVVPILQSISNDDLVFQYCSYWLESASDNVAYALQQLQWVVPGPLRLHVLTLLNANRLELLRKDQPDLSIILLEVFESNAAGLRSRAAEALALLTDERTLDLVARHWFQNRNPDLERMLVNHRYTATEPPQLKLATALLQNRDDLINEEGASAAKYLRQFLLGETGCGLATSVQEYLGRRPAQSIIDELWQEWFASESDQLLSALQAVATPAARPTNLRLLSRLILSDADDLRLLEEEEVEALLEIHTGCTSKLKQVIETALSNLKTPAAIEALCRAALNGSLLANRIVRNERLRPQNISNRALLAIQLRQFDQLERDDPSAEHTVSAYFSSEQQIQRLVIQALRASNCTKYLEAILSQNLRRNRNQLSSADWQDLSVALQNSEDWDVIWKIVGIAPATLAVKLIKNLKLVGWEPPEEENTHWSNISKAARGCIDVDFTSGSLKEIEFVYPPSNCGPALNANGTLIATCSAQGLLQIRSVPDMHVVHQFQLNDAAPASALVFGLDEDLFCLRRDGGLMKFSTASMTCTRQVQTQTLGAGLLTDGRYLYLVTKNGSLSVRRLRMLDSVAECQFNRNISAASISPDCNWLALAGRQVDIIDLRRIDCIELVTHPVSADDIICCDNSIVIVGGSELSILGIDANGRVGKTVSRRNHPGASMIVRRSSQAFVVADQDGALWQRSPDLTQNPGFIAKVAEARSIACSADGRALACNTVSGLKLFCDLFHHAISSLPREISYETISLLEQRSNFLDPKERSWLPFLKLAAWRRSESDIAVGERWDDEEDNYEIEVK